MSAEIVKKRGRPKKVLADAIEQEVVESPKVTTRGKSTKAVAKPKTTTTTKTMPEPARKAVRVSKAAPAALAIPRNFVTPVAAQAVKETPKATVSPKAATTPPVASKPAKPFVGQVNAELVSASGESVATVSRPDMQTPLMTTLTPSEPTQTQSQKKAPRTIATPPQPAKAIPQTSSSHSKPLPTASTALKSAPSLPFSAKPTPVTPDTSRILSQVSNLSAKQNLAPPPETPQAPSKVLPIMPAPLSTTPVAKSSSSKPPTPPKIPVAALNSKIVENIAGRAGARPNARGGGGALPPNYRPVARRVTATIVALPIAIVTSWVLYQRCEFPKRDYVG
jgi:hypothetical protein